MEGISWIADKVKDLRRRPYGPPIRNTRLKRRAILKNGECNILPPKFPRRYIYYVKDIFTGLVDAEWKWTLQVLAIGFVGCWLIFSLIWWLIAFVHTDLHEDHLPPRQAETGIQLLLILLCIYSAVHMYGWTPCILNIHGFPSCFLYSLETQHTTGYGLRVITEECPEAIFIMCAQCIIGMIIDSFTVGVVFAKMTRPRLTTYTIQFSRNAVICLRDGELCMMFRVGDLRKSRLVGVSTRVLLIHNRRTKEGEKLKYFETDLEVECDSSGTDLFLIWPVTIVHKINKDSPFYNLSATDMLQCKFEVVVCLDGTIESTGQGTNAKTSYLANEILWGHRFDTMVTFNDDLQCYEANYDQFDNTLKVEMPMCSAAELSSSSDSGNNDQDKDKEENSNADCLGQNKPAQDLPPVPIRTHVNDYKNNTKAAPTTDEQHKQRSSSLELPPRPSPRGSPQLPSHGIRSRRSSICQDRQSQRPISDYHRSRRQMFDMQSPDQKLLPPSKIKKSVLNAYEYSHHTHYENAPEGNERGETPPFPISWV